MKISFKTYELEDATIVHFELDGPITPDSLREMDPPKVDGRKGVILSGRGPIWLHAFLAHHYHPTKFIAIYDPRIGAVVVESHTPDREVGDVVEVGELSKSLS